MADFESDYSEIYDKMLDDMQNGNGSNWREVGMKVYDEVYESFIGQNLTAMSSTTDDGDDDVSYGISECIVHTTKSDIDRHLRSPLHDTCDETRYGAGILMSYAVDQVDPEDLVPTPHKYDKAGGEDVETWVVTIIVLVHGDIDAAAAADACLMSHVLRLETTPDDEQFDRMSSVFEQ